MSKRPEWMSEGEFRAEQRRVYSQLVHDMYYAPEWMKKIAAVLSALLLVGLVVTILVVMVNGAIRLVF